MLYSHIQRKSLKDIYQNFVLLVSMETILTFYLLFINTL